MIPTEKLRFIERIVPTPDYGENTGKNVRILQQFWLPSNEDYEKWLKVKDGEWRDVPLEKENI
jgi:hypothetical protein